MPTERPEVNPRGEIVLYRDPAGEAELQVRLAGDTVWANLNELAELFQTTRQNLTMHIGNIFQTAELQEDRTCKDFLQVQLEGTREVQRNVKHYNLDVIIAVGYRVNSHVATRFRQWATKVLVEYAVKGFAMDDARLKEPGNDYFAELLARIRDIRSSEKRMYQKVTEIFATSTDYNAKDALAMEFFQTVQNKLHWAAHEHTAAEVIKARANATKPDMGLTNYPSSRIRKADVGIAKNYLNADELEILNLLVSQYFDFAETQARRRRPMRMRDWIERLDYLIQLNGDEVLGHKGKVSMKVAKAHAEAEYEKFRVLPGRRDAWEELEEEAKKLEK